MIPGDNGTNHNSVSSTTPLRTTRKDNEYFRSQHSHQNILTNQAIHNSERHNQEDQHIQQLFQIRSSSISNNRQLAGSNTHKAISNISLQILSNQAQEMANAHQSSMENTTHQVQNLNQASASIRSGTSSSTVTQQHEIRQRPSLMSNLGMSGMHSPHSNHHRTSHINTDDSEGGSLYVDTPSAVRSMNSFNTSIQSQHFLASDDAAIKDDDMKKDFELNRRSGRISPRRNSESQENLTTKVQLYREQFIKTEADDDIPQWKKISFLDNNNMKENDVILISEQRRKDKTRIEPLYYEPIDAPGMNELFAKNKDFQQYLTKMLIREKQVEAQRAREYEEEYANKRNEWVKKVDKFENSQKKLTRDPKHREIFERAFPEFKKAREEKEKANRVEKLSLRAQGDGDYLAIPGGSSSSNDELKLLNAVVIPHWMLNNAKRDIFLNSDQSIVKDMELDCKNRMKKLLSSWTPDERECFKNRLSIVGKNFANIAEFLEKKTISECIMFYYLTKKGVNYKAVMPKRKKKGPKVYRAPPMPTAEDLQIGQIVGRDPPMTRPDANILIDIRCCLCNTRIDPCANSSRIFTRSSYELCGIDPKIQGPDLKFCVKCKDNVMKARTSGKCLVKSCSTGKRKTKASKLMPPKWRELDDHQRCFLLTHCGIPREMQKCCLVCYKKINKKLDMLFAGSLNAEMATFEANQKDDDEDSWQEDEISRLMAAVAELGDDWEKIADRVERRSPDECKEQYELSKQQQINNDEDDDDEDDDQNDRTNDQNGDRQDDEVIMEEDTQDIPETSIIIEDDNTIEEEPVNDDGCARTREYNCTPPPALSTSQTSTSTSVAPPTCSISLIPSHVIYPPPPVASPIGIAQPSSTNYTTASPSLVVAPAAPPTSIFNRPTNITSEESTITTTISTSTTTTTTTSVFPTGSLTCGIPVARPPSVTIIEPSSVPSNSQRQILVPSATTSITSAAVTPQPTQMANNNVMIDVMRFLENDPINLLRLATMNNTQAAQNEFMRQLTGNHAALLHQMQQHQQQQQQQQQQQLQQQQLQQTLQLQHLQQHQLQQQQPQHPLQQQQMQQLQQQIAVQQIQQQQQQQQQQLQAALQNAAVLAQPMLGDVAAQLRNQSIDIQSLINSPPTADNRLLMEFLSRNNPLMRQMEMARVQQQQQVHAAQQLQNLQEQQQQARERERVQYEAAIKQHKAACEKLMEFIRSYEENAALEKTCDTYEISIRTQEINVMRQLSDPVHTQNIADYYRMHQQIQANKQVIAEGRHRIKTYYSEAERQIREMEIIKNVNIIRNEEPKIEEHLRKLQREVDDLEGQVKRTIDEEKSFKKAQGAAQMDMMSNAITSGPNGQESMIRARREYDKASEKLQIMTHQKTSFTNKCKDLKAQKDSVSQAYSKARELYSGLILPKLIAKEGERLSGNKSIMDIIQLNYQQKQLQQVKIAQDTIGGQSAARRQETMLASPQQHQSHHHHHQQMQHSTANRNPIGIRPPDAKLMNDRWMPSTSANSSYTSGHENKRKSGLETICLPVVQPNRHGMSISQGRRAASPSNNKPSMTGNRNSVHATGMRNTQSPSSHHSQNVDNTANTSTHAPSTSSALHNFGDSARSYKLQQEKEKENTSKDLRELATSSTAVTSAASPRIINTTTTIPQVRPIVTTCNVPLNVAIPIGINTTSALQGTAVQPVVSTTQTVTTSTSSVPSYAPQALSPDDSAAVPSPAASTTRSANTPARPMFSILDLNWTNPSICPSSASSSTGLLPPRSSIPPISSSIEKPSSAIPAIPQYVDLSDEET